MFKIYNTTTKYITCAEEADRGADRRADRGADCRADCKMQKDH